MKCFRAPQNDKICCLLSNVCVVTSFYQSLQTMSSLIPFSFCATYCTLSKNHPLSGWLFILGLNARILFFMVLCK